MEESFEIKITGTVEQLERNGKQTYKYIIAAPYIADESKAVGALIGACMKYDRFYKILLQVMDITIDLKREQISKL